MILGYKKLFPWNKPTEFDRKIINGHKKHTIRVDQHDRWRTGRRINHCHGVRTKYFDNFYNNDCTGTQKIEIFHRSGEVFIKIDGKHFFDSISVNYTSLTNLIDLVRNDGFEDEQDFFKWFDKDFTGKIIHWTDLRY